MIKTYCDMCGEEITKKNKFNQSFQINKLIARHPAGLCELIGMIIIGDIYVNKNNADVCKYCILDAIIDLDDRKKHVVKDQ